MDQGSKAVDQSQRKCGPKFPKTEHTNGRAPFKHDQATHVAAHRPLAHARQFVLPMHCAQHVLLRLHHLENRGTLDLAFQCVKARPQKVRSGKFETSPLAASCRASTQKEYRASNKIKTTARESIPGLSPTRQVQTWQETVSVCVSLLSCGMLGAVVNSAVLTQ